MNPGVTHKGFSGWNGCSLSYRSQVGASCPQRNGAPLVSTAPPPAPATLFIVTRPPRHSDKEPHMPRVALNVPAPEFTLADQDGSPVSLSDFRGSKNVLLVFNRTFA